MFKAVPKGNYIIIKGNKADANADFLRQGYEDVIGAAVKSGDIKIVGETYTDNWDPSKAQTETEQFLTANGNDVQAVLSENDGMAGGVVAAVTAKAWRARCPCRGRMRLARPQPHRPRPAVDLEGLPPARQGAGEAAMALCKSCHITKVSGTKPFTNWAAASR